MLNMVTYNVSLFIKESIVLYVIFYHVYLLYSQSLKIMMDLEDRSAQGRACGNLGNTHYLLGNFSEAITYHEEVIIDQLLYYYF